VTFVFAMIAVLVLCACTVGLIIGTINNGSEWSSPARDVLRVL
jgi:hypothetical protein